MLNNAIGNEVLPLITAVEQEARDGVKGKIRIVKIQIDDADLLNFITGGYNIYRLDTYHKD